MHQYLHPFEYKRQQKMIGDMAADEDADVFEITDFTTASDWERFVARLEEILHEWKLVNHMPVPPAPRGSFNKNKWLEKTENLQFADFKFVITYKYLQRDDINPKSLELRSSPDDEEEKDKEEALPTVMADLMSLDNDFPSKCHCLCRWFGLQEFLVITPAQHSEAIDNESRIKILLSSISIALNNAGSPIPVFIQIQQNWRRMFGGMSVLPGATIDFDVIHLNKVPPQYNHLAGLLDVFKAKLATQVSPRPTVTVAVRFTYILTEWVNSPWPQEPPDLSSPMEDEVGCSDFKSLPFGACEDPVSEMQMSCTWQSLSEDMIVENQNYSDLDPLQAPHWSVRIIMTEDPNCLLGKYLSEFLKNSYRTESMQEILHNVLSKEEETDQTGDISVALQKLTEPKVSYNIPSLSSVVTKASSRLAVKQGQAPISAEILNDILFFLFPDAKDPTEKELDTETEQEDKNEDIPESKYSKILQELPKQLKSAEDDSLVHKLAVCLAIVNFNHGGLRGVSQLWQEFVLEMRYRWENKYLISGIKSGVPNLGACLLYQKLQMLNCCIERKIKREQMYKGYTGNKDKTDDSSKQEDENDDCHLTDSEIKDSEGSKESQTVLKTSSSKSSQIGEGSDNNDKDIAMATGSSKNRNSDEIPAKIPHLESSSDDEEEFYECEEEQMETEEATGGEVPSPTQEKTLGNMGESMDTTSITSESSFKDTVTHKPEGRLTPCSDLKLVNIDEQMYIPVTQEPSPMTEDMLEEHAEILARLGTSSEGAQLRARMQSACLVSDMESFKAANPGCTLEDFVRWYSPRDWIKEEVEVDGKIEIKGHLSARMQIPGNVWVEVWQSARAVPARRQKRLFDDTKEAEKVLHYLSSIRPSDLVLNLMPALVHSSISTIIQNEDSDIPKLKDLIEQLVVKASKVTRSPHQEIKRYEELLRSISLSETLIARARSLKNKFSKDLLERPRPEAVEEVDKFISELLHYPEVAVHGGPSGPSGSIIHKLFVAAQKELHMIVDDELEDDDSRTSAVPDFPRPSAREYILRTAAPRPAPYSKTLPHKMFCSIMEGHEFRLAGAFSSDTIFQ